LSFTSIPLEFFSQLARDAGTPEFLRLAKTVTRWKPQILSVFTTGRANALSEAMSLITEKIRRVAHGMRNFENYRLRLLLHSGIQRDTHRTARISGRSPRLVA
jgi:transposase